MHTGIKCLTRESVLTFMKTVALTRFPSVLQDSHHISMIYDFTSDVTYPMDKLDLVATVKSSIENDGLVSCAVFLTTYSDVSNVRVYQYRDESHIGEWDSVGFENGVLQLKRVSGSDALEPVDALYVDHVEPAKPEPHTTFVWAMTFSGKNWKLASEKKWNETSVQVDLTSAVLGEVAIRGKLHEVRRAGEVFVATLKAV